MWRRELRHRQRPREVGAPRSVFFSLNPEQQLDGRTVRRVASAQTTRDGGEAWACVGMSLTRSVLVEVLALSLLAEAYKFAFMFYSFNSACCDFATTRMSFASYLK